jgi:colanic acid biosynthesis glycosyl transferase WcaI
MRVLVLIIQFPPDVNSSGLLMAQLCEGLVARGHQVTVITTFPHYARFRIEDEFRHKLVERSTFNGIDVLRLWVFAHGSKRKMLVRLASYVSFNLLAMLAGLLLRRRYDVILCSNGSFFSGVAANVIAAARRIPFIYNVQDLYPETPVQAGQLRNKAAIRVLERLERFMYARAKHVTVIGDSFRTNILAKGVDHRKVSTIPNFADTEFIRPVAKDNAFSRRHGLINKFVVTHAGNVGYVYDLETLIDAADLLRDKHDVVFLIVGDGVARPSLEAKVRDLSLDNVRFLPFQPRDVLPMLRAASDVQLALYRQGASRYSMPSKVYEIMASGRPVLASAEPHSDLWKLVRSTGCGMCVEPDDPTKLAAAIELLRQDQSRRLVMGLQGRCAVEQQYSRDVVVNQYAELIDTVGAAQA